MPRRAPLSCPSALDRRAINHLKFTLTRAQQPAHPARAAKQPDRQAGRQMEKRAESGAAAGAGAGAWPVAESTTHAVSIASGEGCVEDEGSR